MNEFEEELPDDIRLKRKAYRAAVGEALQAWLTTNADVPEDDEDRLPDGGIVTCWIAIGEIATPDGRRFITAVAGSGIDGVDDTTRWQRRGMLAEYMDE